MSIAQDLRKYVIQPMLDSLPEKYQQKMNSHEAVTLLLGTAMAESGGAAIAQLGGGPAAGLCQMEPATHNDIWKHWLMRDKHYILQEWVAEKFGKVDYEKRFDMLYGNAFYAFFMARCHYYRVYESIPAPADGNIKPYARYWKEHYNTHMGSGTIEHFVKNWRALTNG